MPSPAGPGRHWRGTVARAEGAAHDRHVGPLVGQDPVQLGRRGQCREDAQIGVTLQEARERVGKHALSISHHHREHAVTLIAARPAENQPMAEPLYDDCTRRLSALAGAPDEWDARARFPVVNRPFVVGPSSGRTMAAASGRS